MISITPPAPLWPHQERNIKAFAYGPHPYRALLHDMGLGKTRTASGCVAEKEILDKRLFRLFVLCPTMCVEQWAREFRLWPGIAGAAIDPVQVLEGSGVKRTKALQTPGKRIFITNIEAISIGTFWQAVCVMGWDFLIVDELHRFKNPQSKRFRALLKLADCVHYRLGLSGTPVPNNYMDLWAQFRVLGKAIFGENFYTWRARWFFDNNAGMPKQHYFPDWQPTPQALLYFNAALSQISDRAEKRDVLKLPPLVRTVVYVDLIPGTQRDHYKAMEKDFLTQISADDFCVADIVLTKLLRLQQITCGILPGDSGIEHQIPTYKLGVLRELLEDLCPRHKVLVWVPFLPCIGEVEQLCEDLGLYHVSIHGGVTGKDRTAAVDSFATDPKMSVCVATQQAAGTGTDGLQAASYMIYYGRTYNLEHDQQSEARAYRAGSERHASVTRIDIVTRGTIEEEIVQALQEKKELGALIFGLRQQHKTKRAA